ncbi:MAG: hypothetical protein RLZ67_188 [Actinomycetota bacterium]
MLAKHPSIGSKYELSPSNDNRELLSLGRSGWGLCEIVRVCGGVRWRVHAEGSLSDYGL